LHFLIDDGDGELRGAVQFAADEGKSELGLEFGVGDFLLGEKGFARD
jgi:hypothetical protein